MPQADGKTYSFGDFALTTTPLRLSSNGAPVKLRTQALQLLALLASRPGELFTYRQIRETLWNGRVVDFTRGIHVCIRQIRAALGDDAERPRYVETIPRQGYRFVAPVSLDVPTEIVLPADTSVSLERRPLARFIAGATVIVLAGLAILLMKLAPAPEEEPEARDSYLRGKYLLDKGAPAEVATGVKYLNEALAADANYAPAHVGLAEAYRLLGRPELARRHAARALEIDPESAHAHVQYAIGLMQSDWDWSAAARHLHRALELEPNSPKALHVSSSRLAIVGDMKTALSQMHQAVRLDPVSTLLRADYGWLLYLAGDNDGAIARCREALDLDSRHVASLLCLERAAEAKADHAVAAEAAFRLMNLWGADRKEVDSIARMSAGDALRAFHVWLLRFYSTYPDPSAISADDLAYAHASTGDFAGAMAQLERAAEARSPSLPFTMADPLLTPLHRNARFSNLRVRLNLGEAKSPG